MTMKTLLSSLLILQLTCVIAAAAPVPSLVNYQGRLTDAEGDPVTGPVNIAVQVFDAAAAGAALYQETVGAVTVENGIYQFTFGAAGDGIGAALAVPEAYLEVAVDGIPVLPRLRLVAVPYALRAATADAAASVTGEVPGTFNWQTVAGNAQATDPNHGYVAANDRETVVFTLPGDAQVGDLIRLTGSGAGGWKIAQGEGQRILLDGVFQPGEGDVWTPFPAVWTARANDLSRPWSGLALAGDGSQLFAAAGGTGRDDFLYRSADGGRSWEEMDMARRWTGVAASRDGQRLAAVVGGTTGTTRKIYLSSDGGDSWAPRESDRNWTGITSSADGETLVASALASNLLVSSDGGTTWTGRDTRLNWTAVACSAAGDVMLGAPDGGRLRVSVNGGTTWIQAEQARAWQAVAVAADGSVLVAGVASGFLYLSTDGGTTWQARLDDLARNWRALAVSDDGSVIAAAAANGQIFTSTDSGATWEPSESVRAWRGLAVSPDGTFAAAAADGNFIYTARRRPTTAPGAAGFLAGGQNSSVELQYLGDGLFAPVLATGQLTTESRDPVGESGPEWPLDRIPVLGGDKLAAGAVGLDHLDSASVDLRYVTRDDNGQVELAGPLRIAVGNPGAGRVLISDASGFVSWRPLAEVVQMQYYEPQPVDFPDSPGAIAIAGVLASPITARIINGPGIIIDRLPGAHPSNPALDWPGLNQEMDFVFDYDGPEAGALAAWQAAGTTATATLAVPSETGPTSFTWTLTGFRLATIAPAPGGGQRYTLIGPAPADQSVGIQRSQPWQTGQTRGAPALPEVEIEGVSQPKFYPDVEIDVVNKTITLTATYDRGGSLFNWVAEVAGGSGTMRAISLVYQDWSDTPQEVARNNYFSCFPIRYQHFTGFGYDRSARERVVIAYGWAENGVGGALFVPPADESSPGTSGVTLTRDPVANRFFVEIDSYWVSRQYALEHPPVLIQGPGFETERIGAPLASSGFNREFPLVFDLPTGGSGVQAIRAWQTSDRNERPLGRDARSLSIIVTADGTWPGEVYRINMYEMVPAGLQDLGDGFTRVTLLCTEPPDRTVHLESASDPGYWGNASLNNPATDTRVDISGLTVGFYPQLTDDPAARTLTLDFDYGEGEALLGWARQIGSDGTAVHGKRTLTADPLGAPVIYSGCFPISWQLVGGLERAARGRQKVVLSYDGKSP
jgi:hypothetical protein